VTLGLTYYPKTQLINGLTDWEFNGTFTQWGYIVQFVPLKCMLQLNTETKHWKLKMLIWSL